MIDWRRHAACRGFDTELFFAKADTLDGQAALQICESCPVARECLNFALECEYWAYGKPTGIYGGFAPSQRNEMRLAARSGKCKKHLHEMTGDNVAYTKKGKRVCRECARERERRKAA